MSANNLTGGTQLETATARGDIARGVIYLDRRLSILRNMANSDQDCREVVLEAVESYPTYNMVVESLQFVAARHNELHTSSTVFGDMTSGKLIRNWRNVLVALHVRLHGATAA